MTPADNSKVDALLKDLEQVENRLDKTYQARDAALAQVESLTSRGKVAALLETIKQGGTITATNAKVDDLNTQLVQLESAAAYIRQQIAKLQESEREAAAKALVSEHTKLVADYAAALITAERIGSRLEEISSGPGRAYPELLPGMAIPRVQAALENRPHSLFSQWLREAVAKGLISETALKSQHYRY
jgi:hypothetical protein